ncbi:MAG: BamA/TamA family outer membrane protein [Vicingaceae bacterium]
MAPNEKLVNKVKVKIDHPKLDKEEISSIVKQKPNRRLLGLFRFNLWVFNLYKIENDSKIKRSIGEPPVVYDSLLTQKTVKQMSVYLNEHGFFKNKVSYKVIERKNKKINIEYDIKSGTPYTIRNIKKSISDPKINTLLSFDDNSLIKPGTRFDVKTLEKERDRIVKNMKNEGLYNFNKEYISFKADSSLKSNQIDLELIITNPISNTLDSNYSTYHKTYYFKNIYVHLLPKKGEATDTTLYNGIYFIHKGKLKIRPKVIAHTIFLKPENLYLLNDQENTYKHLAGLGIFKFVNITYEDVSTTNENLLDCHINLSFSSFKSLTTELEGTNNGGNIGVGGNLIYQNKNIFKGAEHFSFKTQGSFSVQQSIAGNNNTYRIIEGLPFNAMSFGPEMAIDFPKFLLPVSIERFSKRANPRSEFNAAFNYQVRPDYIRTLNRISFGYNWMESKTKKHIFYPIDISSIKLDPKESFQEILDNISDPFILNSYNNHFISAAKYSFIFNNQEVGKFKNFSYFNGNIELAGNLLNAYDKFSNQPIDETTKAYTIFGIRYAQYVKSDIDFRQYFVTPHTAFVTRFYTGIGVPYGNLPALPFEKSFFAGGANGIRAWRARTLGPGSLADSLIISTVDQIGEFQLETNLEYRFDITRIIEGALFTDIGNIWLLYNDDNKPNAEFRPSRIWRDIAIGIGVGIRFDFSFFLIRFDAGTPLKDPSSIHPEKINFYLPSTILNIGIGYPF